MCEMKSTQKLHSTTEEILMEHQIYLSSIRTLMGKPTEPKFQAITNEGIFFVKYTQQGHFSKRIRNSLSLAQTQTGALCLPLISENRPDLNYQVNIYPWVDGINMKTWSTTATLADCYHKGECCGRLLNSIHNATVTTKSGDLNIASHMMENIEIIAQSKIDFPKMKELWVNPVLIVEQLQRDVSSALVHLDFKPKNIMLSHNELYVVDWDSCTIADPWLDFWDKGLSLHPKRESFSAGLLDGYFSHAIPTTFWNYFQALSVFAFLQATAWAIKRGDESHSLLLENYLWESYQGFSVTVPIWYNKYSPNIASKVERT